MFKACLFFACIFLVNNLNAQAPLDTTRDIRLYKPPATEAKDTIPVPDTTAGWQKHIRDSIAAREIFIRDSIIAREKFVRDSLIAREIFVRDSILKRQRILDSLNFLKSELPVLFEAALKSMKDDLMVQQSRIEIKGDSILSDYEYRILPFNLTQPYSPWKLKINLSDNPVKINVDEKIHKISSIQAPAFSCSFNYDKTGRILIINEPGSIQAKQSGNLYKAPLDSVFYNHQKQIVKIKRYIRYYQVLNNYQRGSLLFTHLAQVRQYDYNVNSQMITCQLVNFCEPQASHNDNKVCYIIDYALNIRGKIYSLTRKNNPSNNYSDGTYTFEFDSDNNLRSLAFNNISNSENWKTFVDLNNDGYVSRYTYQVNGKVNQSLDIIYHPDASGDKNKIELITNTFEDDGVSYFQKNNTTGKSRVRDRTTGEWSPWK